VIIKLKNNYINIKIKRYHFFVTGKNASKIWEKLEDAIRVVCLEKESAIINLMKNYKSKTNFFEMVRFDFVVDNDLNVYIMEVSYTFFYAYVKIVHLTDG